MSIGSPYKVFTDRSGQPLEEGYIYIGVEGLNPQTNPVLVYTDSLGTTAINQPIRTSGGYPVFGGSPTKLFVQSFDFSISVLDKRGQLVFTSLSDNF
jgi:hypothetical protein